MNYVSRIYIVIGIALIGVLVTLATFYAYQGNWCYTVCNSIWACTTVLMIIQTIKNRKLWDQKETFFDRIVEAVDIINRKNAEINQLKEEIKKMKEEKENI